MSATCRASAMGRTCVCTRRGRARGAPGGLCRHFYVRRSEGAAPQPPPEARPPGPCPPPWDPRAAAPAVERGAREAVSGESARALKRSVCDPRSPQPTVSAGRTASGGGDLSPRPWSPGLGGPGWGWDPSLLWEGAGSGDVPPHSQPPHTSVGPARPVSPSPLVWRRPLVRVPSYSTAAPQAQVVAIGGRCVVSTWWGEEASMALAARPCWRALSRTLHLPTSLRQLCSKILNYVSGCAVIGKPWQVIRQYLEH